MRTRLLRSSIARMQGPRFAVQLPSLATTMGVLFYVDYPRPALIAACIAAFIAVVPLVGTAIAAKKLGFDARRFYLAQLIVFFALILMVGATGGLWSPIFPMFVIVGCVLDLPHGRRPKPSFALLTLIALAGLAFWPREYLGPPLDPIPYAIVATVATAAIVVTVALGLDSLWNASIEAGQTLERLREEVLTETTGRAKSLESVSSKVAHELKNPLASIKGMAQLLERGAADERAKARLAVIVEEAARMEVILADYLSFTRPLEDLRPQRIDVRALILDLLAIIEPRAEAAKIRLTLSEGTASIVADPRRLKEAMLNLLSNAIESTPPEGTVTVDIRRDEDGVTIVVRDTGKGMDADTLERVGTPFFTTREGGTGLGVVLTRSAIMQHGGEVKYQSKVGEGTAVTVRLPREPKGAPDGPNPSH